MTKLPDRVHAMKVSSYNVEEIVDAMLTTEYKEKLEDITIEDILDWIGDDVDMDIAGNNVIYQDENGEEL
jgi:hypothetical protein